MLEERIVSYWNKMVRVQMVTDGADRIVISLQGLQMEKDGAGLRSVPRRLALRAGRPRVLRRELAAALLRARGGGLRGCERSVKIK